MTNRSYGRLYIHMQKRLSHQDMTFCNISKL